MVLVVNPSTVVPEPTDSDLSTIKLLHLVIDFSFDTSLLLLTAAVSFAVGVPFGKPVITTNWSGHVDFIKPEYNVLIGGELENIHPSTANDMLLKEGQWFKPDDGHVKRALKDTFKKYKQRLV